MKEVNKEKKLLKRIKRTVEECRTPEGLDVKKSVKETIEKYWQDKRKSGRSR